MEKKNVNFWVNYTFNVHKTVLCLKVFTEKFLLMVFHEWGPVIARAKLEDTWCHKDWNYGPVVNVFVNIEMGSHLAWEKVNL